MGGTVPDAEGGRPVSGAVVLPISATNAAVLGRYRTSSTGRYELRVSESGRYLLRVLRIGSRPFESDAVALSPTSRQALDMVVPALRVQSVTQGSEAERQATYRFYRSTSAYEQGGTVQMPHRFCRLEGS